MIKKIAIEQNDLLKMEQWDKVRRDKIADKLDDLQNSDSIYVISFDIASEDSKDNSVMMHFRLVDGNYIYEGHENL